MNSTPFNTQIYIDASTTNMSVEIAITINNASLRYRFLNNNSVYVGEYLAFLEIVRVAAQLLNPIILTCVQIRLVHFTVLSIIIIQALQQLKM